MTVLKLAANHHNTAGLLALHDISPPLFKRYKGDVRHIWHDYEARVRDGRRGWKWIGRPWIEILLQALTESEKGLLRSTFCPGTAENAPVTVYCYNQRVQAWIPYNGTFHWPGDGQSEWYLEGWRGTVIVIDDLQPISAHSDGFAVEAHA
jgi:hypothetical protein